MEYKDQYRLFCLWDVGARIHISGYFLDSDVLDMYSDNDTEIFFDSHVYSKRSLFEIDIEDVNISLDLDFDISVKQFNNIFVPDLKDNEG